MESCEECAPGYLANDTRSTDFTQCSSRSIAHSRPHDNVHLFLPKELGGKVAKMHFSLLGAELIVLVGSAAGTMAFLASGGASVYTPVAQRIVPSSRREGACS